MNNLAICTIYSLLASISIILLVLSFKKSSTDTLDKRFRLIVIMLLGWQIPLILFYGCKDANMAIYLYDLNLPFVAGTALAWFLYLVYFYGLDDYFPRVVKGALAILPIATTIIVLTTPWHPYLRTDIVVESMEPLKIISSVRGPWFWYHAIYCYLLLFISMIMVFTNHRKTARLYRRSSSLLMLCICITALGNILVLASIVEIDLSLLSLSIVSLILYLINRNSQGLEFFLNARHQVYHWLGHGILIVDSLGEIVNMNQTALKFLEALGIPSDVKHMESVMAALMNKTTKKVEQDSEDGGTDYYLDTETVYNIRRKVISDNYGGIIGFMVLISDVKENRSVINYLDTAAGIDALTGISNRRRFEEAMASADNEALLPLAIIVGDLNNLKTTNDRLGHVYGDTYIRLSAELLKDVCPPNANIARVGGDEFYILVPNFNRNKAALLVDDIEEAFNSAKGYPFTPSISLGFEIKENMGENVADILDAADKAMYRNKQVFKIANENLNALKAQGHSV